MDNGKCEQPTAQTCLPLSPPSLVPLQFQTAVGETPPQPQTQADPSIPADPNQTALDAYYASYYAYYGSILNQPQNSNPNPDYNSQIHDPTVVFSAGSAGPPVPSVESYASVISRLDASAALYQTVDTTAYHNSDLNAQSWAWKEAIRLYGVDPNGHAGAGNGITPQNMYQNTLWANPQVQIQLQAQPHGTTAWNKRLKKTKVVQSAFCEVCRVDCNGPSVLEQHRLGKKHQKNLEKLQGNLSFGMVKSSSPSSASLAVSSVPLIGPQENPKKRKGVNNRKKSVESAEDLETKRRKIVECGVAAESVRTCEICNVVCNSEKVFSDHIAGQKHGLMIKKRAAQRNAVSGP